MSGKVLILCAAVMWMTGNTQAQNSAPHDLSSTEQHGKKSADKFLGLKDCYNCHTNGFPKDDFGSQFGILANDSWIRGDEVRIWGKDDKHAQAYTSLLSETGKRIGNHMSPAVISHHDKRCLACHTGYPISSMETETGEVHGPIKADLYEKNLKVTAGVSCEGCHGAAGDWLSAHIQKDDWRFLNEEKKAEKGFTDVRSVVSRTKLCLSCHLGNAREGRVVTHEMYAAGHPPLPAFELATYEAAMPRHWRSLSEKADDVRQEFLKKTGQQDHGVELYRSKSLLMSSLISRSESLRLTADLAEGDEDGEGVVSTQISKPQWPDFAQFDCYACHHDLKSDSWRQKAQHAGSPGRPVLTPWPEALLQVAMHQHSDAAALQQALAEVESATLASPFGRRDTLIQSSRRAAELAEEMAVAISNTTITEKEGRSILDRLIEIGATEVLDYDSARQLVWAYSVMKYELDTPPTGRSTETLHNPPAPIPLPMELAPLKDVFILDLRQAGLGKKHTIPTATNNPSRDVLEIDLSRVLPKIAIYSPEAVQTAFAALNKKP